MRFDEFENGLSRMVSWWNRKPLTDEQVKIWFRKFGSLPAVAWTDMIEGVTNECRYFPTPKDLDDRWYKWRQDNPSLWAREARRNISCVICAGSGMIFLWGAPGTFVRCGHCGNSDAIPAIADAMKMTVDQITEHGWRLDPCQAGGLV